MISDSPQPYSADALAPSVDVELEQLTFIPIYDVTLGAGQAGVQRDEVISGHVALLTSWLRSTVRVSPDRTFVAPIFGHSMENRFFDGDLVLGEMTPDVQVMSGIYAVALNGEIYVKHLHRDPRGTITLISENSIYPPIDVREGDEFRVIGRIVRRITRP